MSSDKQEIFRTVLEVKPTSEQSRKFQIVEAAIENYSSIGYDRTTYDRIAQTCGISRPLINRYFENKKEIFKLSLKYIRAHMQETAIAAIKGHSQTDEQLRVYIESTFMWADQYPRYAHTWLLFFYYAAIDPEFKELLTQINTMGQHRIAALIKLGNKQNIFECDSPDYTAKWIQTAITGALITLGTEETNLDRSRLKDRVIERCFSCLKS